MKYIMKFAAAALSLTMMTGMMRPPILDAPKPDLSNAVIVGVHISDDLPQSPYDYKVIIADEGEDIPLSSLGAMPYLSEDGNVISIDVNWDITDPELYEPGFHEIKGTPILKDGMTLADGFDGTTTYPMFRYGEGASLEVLPIQDHLVSDRLITLGSTDPENEISIVTQNRRAAVGKNGFILTDAEWSWEWDFSSVDTSSAGAYEITGTLVSTPSYITVPEEYRTAVHTVYVMDDKMIDIRTPYELTANGMLVFHWLHDSTEVSDAILQMQADGGIWEDCPDKWYSYKSPSKFSSASLILDLLRIPAGEYSFRLEYTENSEICFTETLLITVPENIAEIISNASGSIPDELNIGGDRDGGDFGGNPMPDFEQNLPVGTFGSSFANDAAKVRYLIERVTDSSTTVYGLRLELMTASGNTVLFEKQGVSVEIPSDILRDLELSYSASLTVTVKHPETSVVFISVTKGGEDVKNITGTKVTLPWDKADGTRLSCSELLTGIKADNITFDEENGLLSFEISSGGTYVISAEKLPSSDTVVKPEIKKPVRPFVFMKKVYNG